MAIWRAGELIHIIEVSAAYLMRGLDRGVDMEQLWQSFLLQAFHFPQKQEWVAIGPPCIFSDAFQSVC